MKKGSIILSVLLSMAACGNKTNSAVSDADTVTIVNEVSDTLYSVEAVVKQVDAVYEYHNQMREHFDENKPSLD